MALYLRLLGADPTSPKIPIHAFQSVAGEWARGKITNQQANTIVATISGVGLSAEEATEAQTLVTTVTSIALTGSAAQIADARARRAARVTEIDQCLLLADAGAPGYATEVDLKAKLGV
jgi:hypothetical protein